MQKKRIIIIDVDVTKRLVGLLVGLVASLLLLTLILTGESRVATASGAAETTADGMRQFYLSWGWFSTPDSPSACVQGYHFASLWEIADPSNLKYNTYYGRDKDDSGEGPPSGYFARVRTGYSSNNSNTVGQANCNNWSSSTGYGTKAALLPNWSSSPDIGVWDVIAGECDETATIWCIED